MIVRHKVRPKFVSFQVRELLYCMTEYELTYSNPKFIVIEEEKKEKIKFTTNTIKVKM